MPVTNDFSSSQLNLNGAISLSQPTALVWGPDGRLYVTEVGGDVKVLTIAFGDPDPNDGDGTQTFYVTEGYTLTSVSGFNYNDDGTYNPGVTDQGRARQVTGIEVVQQYDANGDPVMLASGKPAVDIYVTSSDPRHGAGNNGEDSNLDTNSGVVHRLRETVDLNTVASADDAFDTVDLVRGFARSEENHSINGLEIIQELDGAGKLVSERAIVAVGGNANNGAPSNNFAAQQEYATSAGIFELDLTMLDGMAVQVDATSGRDYIYDLPTLDDVTQPGANDLNGAFGGNDGANQATLGDQADPTNPVKMYSPGYRNAYDIEITEDGRVWTYDNGANNGWGGRPIGEGGDNGGTTDNPQLPGYIATNLNNGDGNANDEVNLENWNPSNLDNFHEITRSDDLDAGQTLSVGANGPVTTYTDPATGLTLVYGGHPNPTRAEGAKAGILFSPEGTDEDTFLLVSNTSNAAGTPGAPSDYDDVIAWFNTVEDDDANFPSSTSGNGAVIGAADGALTNRVIGVEPGVLYDLYESTVDQSGIAVVAGATPNENPPANANFIGQSGLPSNINDVVFATNAIEGNYLEAGYTDGALDSAFGSVNGLAEYTSTILDDAQSGVKMSGAILASTFNGGGLIVMGRNEDGTMSSVQANAGNAIAADRTVINDSGLTLGLATVGDNVGALGLSNAFQGSIWAAAYQLGQGLTVNIEIFQPNGVGLPMAGEIPFDDTDKDGDGVDVFNDPFEFSANNGFDMAVGETLTIDFEANTAAFSGTFSNTGLLGAALDGVTENQDAQTAAEFFPVDQQRDGLFDDGGNIIPGGNAPVFQIKNVTPGTVVGTANSARDAMHTGVKLDADVKTLVATLSLENWVASESGAVQDGQFSGMMFSDGTQSNFLRAVIGGIGGGNSPGLEVGYEIGDANYTTLASINIPGLNDALNPNLELRLSIRGIGSTFDVMVEYKLETETSFTEVPLNGGAGFQLPAGVLQDVLTGAHTISNGDAGDPVLSSGAAIGLLAETPTGTALPSIDFNNLAIEARGNEIMATTGAEVGSAGTAETDTLVYTGTDTALAPLASDMENFDGTESTADYAVTGNEGANRIEVGTGANTITTGAGADHVVGTLAQLDGDTITDMSMGDTVIITDLTAADAAGATYGGTGQAELTINGATLTFSGPDFADFDPVNGAAVFTFTDTPEGLAITAMPPSMVETIVYRINFGADGTVAAIDGGPDWIDDNAVTDGFSSTLIDTYTTPANFLTVDFDNVNAAVAPAELFHSEAGDNTSGDAPETINFEVEVGRTYRIEYYYTENFQGIFNKTREFDVSVDGVVPEAFDGLNPLAEANAYVVSQGGVSSTDAGVTNTSPAELRDTYLNVARKAEYVYTATDDTLNLALIHQAENPKVNAIQVTLFGTPSMDALISIGDAPAQVEAGDTGASNTVELTLDVDQAGFTGTLTLDYDVTVNGVSTAYLNQPVVFTDTEAVIAVTIPADIQNNGDDVISVTLTGVAEEGYAIDGGAATGTSVVTEDDAPVSLGFPFTETANGDLSDDRFNPTDLGELNEGDNLVTATQQGDLQPGGRERDYFTFEIPEGQVLTQLILESYIAGEPFGSQAGFMGLASGTQMNVDPLTIAAGQSIPELLGGHVYDPTEVGSDLLPQLADGETYGITTQGFNLPLGPGVYTFWLNQGGEASTPTVNFKTVLAASLPSIAIGDAPTVVENGDVDATVLAFPVTITPAEATTLTLSYSVDGGAVVTADVTFDAAGNGTLSVDVPSDDAFTGTDVVSVTLTAAASATPGSFYVIDGVANGASGEITEDDDALPTAQTGDLDGDMILNENDTDIDGDGNGSPDNSTSTDGVLDAGETFVFDGTNAGTALAVGQVVRLDFDLDGTPFMNGFTGALLSPNGVAPEIDLNAANVSGGTLNISVNKGDHFAAGNSQQNAFVSAYTASQGLSVETRFVIPDFDSATPGVQASKNFQGVGVVIGTDQDNLVKAVWGRNNQSFELAQDNADGGGTSGVTTNSSTTPAGAAEIMIRLEVFIENVDVGGTMTPTAKAKAVATFYDAAGLAIVGFEDVQIGEITLEDNALENNTLKTTIESGAAVGAGVIQTSVGNSAADSFDVSYQYVEVKGLGMTLPGDNIPVVSLTNLVASVAEDADVTASTKLADITITDEGLSPVSLTLAGDDAALFQIVDNGGALELHLIAGAALDFETNPSLDVTVEATDSAGTGTAAFSASVSDVNEAPSISGAIADASTPEGTATSVDLSGLVLTDVDAGDMPALKVLIDGVDVASVAGFTLNGTTLEVADDLAKASYAVTVLANDGALDSASAVAFSVTVADNGIPAPTLSVTVPATVDGDISVTLDFGEPVFGFDPASVTLANGAGLALTSGTANFQPGDQQVVVTFAAPLGGFAQDTDYTASIIEGAVLDGDGNGSVAGASAPATYAVDEAPVFTAGATAIDLDEETDGVIATYGATDPESDAVTYALDAAGQALGFTIDPTTGALSAPAGGFDYETLAAGSGTTLTFDVIASSTGTSGAPLTTNQSVTVEVQDTTEATVVTFEVEDFDNVSPISQTSAGEFFEENQSAASGGQVARLGANSNGTASLTLDGSSGVVFGPNKIEVSYFDEDDGVSSFTLNVNGTPVGSVTLNNDGGGNAAQSVNLRVATFDNVTLPENAVITIDGASQGGEFVRLDKITISTADGNPGGGDNQAPAAVGTIDLSGLTQGDTINVALEGANPIFVDPDEDALTYVLSANAPDFLAIVDNVLVNTRPITNDDVIASLNSGPVTLTVTANDGTDGATVMFDIEVANLNDAPVVIPENVSTLDLTTTESAITPIEAAGFFDDADLALPGSTEALSYTATGLPTNLVINPTTGQITGILTTAGAYQVAVTATDSAGAQATANFTINVTGEPVLGDPIRIQVEDFDNIADPGGFFVENQGNADENQVARLGANGSGEATLALDGVDDFVPGTFDITLGFFDENDGDSVVTVKLRTDAGDEVISQIVFNADNGGNAAQASSFREVTLSDIALPAGATLVLEGQAEGYSNAEAAAVAGRTKGNEFVRLDYVDLTPVDAVSDNFAPFPIPGFDTTLEASEGSATFDVANAFGDPEEDVLTYALAPAAGETEVPAFLSIDPATGVITMTGAFVSEDTQVAFQVTATDQAGSGQSASQDFTLDITDVPVPGAELAMAASQTEGVAGQVTISLINMPAGFADPVTLRLELVAGATGDAATPGADVAFDGAGATTVDVVIQPGAQGQQALVIVDDGPIEALESYQVQIIAANVGSAIDANALQLPLGGAVEAVITDADDAPVALGENASVEEGDAVTFDPAASDTDGDSSTLTVTAIDTSATTGGTVVLNANGTVTVTADDETAGGTISFGYTVEDEFGNASAGTETVSVTEDTTPNETIALRINAFGADIPTLDGGPAWFGDIVGGGARQYLTVDDDRGDTFDGYDGDPNVIPTGVPEAILDSARSSDDPFSYSIPVTEIGGAGLYRVNLYFAELFAGAQESGERSFDASLEGTVIAAFNDIDPGGLFGANVGVLSGEVDVQDGVLNIGFLQDLNDNPIVNGIEIIKIGETTGDTDGPTASLSLTAPVETTDPLLVNVTLADASGIDAASLGASDIEVLQGGAPAGTVLFTGFVDGVASYTVAAPAGGWTDGASVQVTLKAGEVLDLAPAANGNAAASTSFTLDVTEPVQPTEVQAILQAAQGVDSGASYAEGTIGSASLKIMEGEDDVQSSNFGGNSFILENTGGKQIAAVVLDFREALYGDSVIDTDGSSGDLATKPFQVQSGASASGVIASGTNNVLSLSESYFFAGDEPNPDPDAGAANGGFRGLLLRFDGSNGGFANGEQIGFSGDMDPNSVATIAKAPLDSGALSNWDVGGISGAELIGSSFTVMFDDGTFATGYLGSDGSQAGSTGKATQAAAAPSMASVVVNGTGSNGTGTYGGTEPVIVVTGTPGDTVLVTMSKGLNPVTNATDGIAQDVADRLSNAQPEFEVNNAGNFQTVQVTIGVDGTATLPAGSFDYNDATDTGITFGGSAFTEAFATAPMVIAASVVDGDGEPAGPVDRVYLTSNGQPVDTTPPEPEPTDVPVFIEDGGLIVIEAESGMRVDSWEDAGSYSTAFTPDVDDPAAATGGDFIVWQGDDSLDEVNHGIIEYDVQITMPGTYRFQMRSQVGLGEDATEHNDTWLKIDADQFYGVRGNDLANPTSVVAPIGAEPGTFPDGAGVPLGAGADGYFKVYSSKVTDWTWNSFTSDGIAHQIYADFDAPGIYTISLAARSSSHVIDRLVLAHVDEYSRTAPRNLSLEESERLITGDTAPTVVAPIADIQLIEGNGTTINGAQAFLDLDGDDLDFLISGPAGVTIDGETGLITVADTLTDGSYTVTVTAFDDDTNQVSDSFDITVIGDTAPTVVDPIDDVLLQLGATTTVDAAAAFNDLDGDDLDFLISGPAGVTIDPETGLISVAGTLAVGTYAVTVTAFDEDTNQISDTFDIEVVETIPGTTVSYEIASGADDWEQFGGATSGDFELGQNGSQQYAALRFAGIEIPDGATVTEAFIRFTAQEVQTGAAEFNVSIQNSENAAVFSSGDRPVSDSRSYVDEFVWNPEAWDVVGAQYDSPELASLIMSVIGSDGVSDGSLAFLFDGVSGSRVADSFETADGDVAELFITYEFL